MNSTDKLNKRWLRKIADGKKKKKLKKGKNHFYRSCKSLLMVLRPRMISIMQSMRLRLEFKMLSSMLKRLVIVSGISLKLGFIEFIPSCGLSICGLLDFLSFYSPFLDFCGIQFLIYLLISFGLVEISG